MIKRNKALEVLAEGHFDLLVVGGGITGAGVALDAASRGLNVALIERNDFASGTSGRSSKLVHGGLRYLKQLDFGLVREALLERDLMVKLAPELVSPLPLVAATLPTMRVDRLTRPGLFCYDLLSLESRHKGSKNFPRHQRITGAEVSELVPALAGQEPRFGYLFYDCQTDDVRLTLQVLKTAEKFGAVFANRVEVLSYKSSAGYVDGAEVRDTETDERFRIRADRVVNATGVWADQAAYDSKPEDLQIRPACGVHLILSKDDLPLKAGVIVPAGGGRSVFVLPWLGHILVGTTDTDYKAKQLEHVPPPSEHVDYLLDSVNAFFGNSLGRSDVIGAFAGVRPLIKSSNAKRSVDVSRKAKLYESSDGLITVTGGKLTTWRKMAESAVDLAVKRQGRTAACRTDRLPIFKTVATEELATVPGLESDSLKALAKRYGPDAHQVIDIAKQDEQLARPILAGQPDIFAEAVYAARYEQARSVGDVLFRRTRLGLLEARTVCDSSGIPERTTELLARELGWDRSRVSRETDSFFQEARSEGVVVN